MSLLLQRSQVSSSNRTFSFVAEQEIVSSLEEIALLLGGYRDEDDFHTIFFDFANKSKEELALQAIEMAWKKSGDYIPSAIKIIYNNEFRAFAGDKFSLLSFLLVLQLLDKDIKHGVAEFRKDEKAKFCIAYNVALELELLDR